MRSIARVVLCVLCALVRAPEVAAQETVNYGSISGRVLDQQGAVVPGARASARHVETNIVREGVTDRDGRFRFTYLRVGSYELQVRLAGFDDFTRSITVTIGSAFELPVTLAVAGLSSTVTVSGSADALETARSQIAGTLARSEVEAVPLNGRNFLDLALLIPGVALTNTGSTQLFAETSAVPGQGLSIGSQRNFSNNFIVDGLSANDDASGLSGIPYAVDSVDEFQVVTSGGHAELGRALGGYISVVTRSGTNQPRGQLYGYFRDTRLNARNPLSGSRLPMTQRQYGASMGGPIVRDRTFYFVNAERRGLDQTGLTTIAHIDMAAINARLIAAGYRGALVATGMYPNPLDTTTVLAKIDHQWNPRSQIGLRYSRYDVASTHSRGAGGLNAPSASAGLENVDQSLAFSNTLTLSSRTVSETRAQVAVGDLEAQPTDLVGPAVSISGVASFGTLSGSPQARHNRMVQVVSNLSHQMGAHALRAGADVVHNDDTIRFPRSSRGAYSFASLSAFLNGTYNPFGFTQTFGEAVVSQMNPNIGVYIQDEWKIGSRLTVNGGLRYDLQFLETIETDANNIAPRLGFAWAPSLSRQIVVRGNTGLFFDRVPLRPLANALLSAGNTTDVRLLRQVNVSLSPGQAGAPVFPDILPAVIPAVTLPNLTTMDRNLQNAYSRQASLQVEGATRGAGTFSIGYQYVRGMNLIMQVNQNVPTCAAAGGNNGCRPVSDYANNNQYSSVGDSNYHGLHLSFVQRAVRWGHYRVSYSFSKSMNNVGENFFNSPIDPTDFSKDWGRSDDDQRHRLMVAGAANLPYGIRLSSSLHAYSALPFNITSGLTTIQGTPARPVVAGEFIPRNAGAGSDFFTVSARLSRSLKVRGRVEVEGVVEAFNVTGSRNELTRNTNFGPGLYPTQPSATFGNITATGEPRSVQLGFRMTF